MIIGKKQGEKLDKSEQKRAHLFCTTGVTRRASCRCTRVSAMAYFRKLDTSSAPCTEIHMQSNVVWASQVTSQGAPPQPCSAPVLLSVLGV